jgi:signal transduction histidine kinase
MENFEAVFTPLPQKDEIGLLSQSFSDMARRLQLSRDKLYGLTEFRENLVRSIPVGVISVDGKGIIRSINPAQEGLSQCPAPQLLERPIEEVFPMRPGDCSVLQDLKEVLRHGRPIDLTLDNTPTPFTPETCLRFRIHIAPLRDRLGQVDGAVILQEDLSERARLEVQLIRSDKLSSVGVLAAGVAHEINNPLTTILGYAKLLLEERPPEDRDRPALALVAEEAQRVQQIVRNLLDFSRQESGEVALDSLNALIERTLNLAAPNLRKRGITVERHLARDLPAVRVEGRRLEQVFVNLLTNAAQAMAEGGVLTVRSALKEGSSTVFAEFSDTGTGIAAEHLPRIFDPFYTTKGPGEGTGLGLAISQRILADHGGEIEVESELGVGTTFRVSLPAIDEPRWGPHSAAHESSTHSRRR